MQWAPRPKKQNRGVCTGSPVSILLIQLRTLPAAVASIAAVAVSAAPAATAPAATSSSASAPAEAATTASAPAASTAFAWRASFVDDYVAAHEVLAVESLNGALGFLVVIDFDKPEPAWLPRKAVAHQGDIRRGDSRLRK